MNELNVFQKIVLVSHDVFNAIVIIGISIGVLGFMVGLLEPRLDIIPTSITLIRDMCFFVGIYYAGNVGLYCAARRLNFIETLKKNTHKTFRNVILVEMHK